jgi:competence protein ComEA
MFFRSAALIFVVAAAGLAQTELPDAPAKETVKRICANCHEMETVIASRRTKIGWERITEDMVSRGAMGSDDEMAAVIDYLTANFGKLNVNTASAAEIAKTLGFTEKEAAAIVAWREQNGKFKTFEDLQKVPGVSAEKLKEKRASIAFSL